MKLGKRQSQSIASILSEGRDEIRAASEHRDNLSSRSRLNEALMFEEVESVGSLTDALSLAVEGEASERARDLLSKFERVVYKELSNLVTRFGGEKMSGGALQDHLEDHDLDSIMEFQKSLVSDITSSLNTYAAAVAQLTAHVVLSGADSESASLNDDRYRENKMRK